MGRAVLLLTTMVAVLLAYAGAALAQPSEKIFFGRWLYKDCPGFCMMNPNGGGSQSIKLHDSASDAAPSLDGSKIAYVAGSPLGEPGSNGELWVMNADGSGRTQLTKTMYAEEADPSWSPDGSKLAYTRRSFEPDSPTPSYLAEIWTINIDGSANTRLTTAHYEYFGFDRWGLEAVRSTTASDPDWSPDGSRIAFARSETWPDHRHGRYVYTMNANGSGRTLLTNTDVSASDATMPMDSDPYWSPDGSRIAFDHRIDGQSYSDI